MRVESRTKRTRGTKRRFVNLAEEGHRLPLKKFGPYTVRFPVSLMSFVDERAHTHGWTRSEELRNIVLQAKGQHVA